VQCHRCKKYGHYKNEFSKHRVTNFRNTTDNKNDRDKSNQVKFCQYCKKRNHLIADCRSRIYNKNKRNQGEYYGSNKANNQVKKTVGDIENLVRTIIYMEREHVKCYSPSFIQNETKLFVDSRADMSLNKLFAFKNILL
jgi:hypothetical protein